MSMNNQKYVLIHVMPENPAQVLEVFFSDNEGLWHKKAGLNFQRYNINKMRNSNQYYRSYHFCFSRFHYMSRRRLKKHFKFFNGNSKIVFISRTVYAMNEPILDKKQVLDCLWQDTKGRLWANFKD